MIQHKLVKGKEF